MIRFDQKIILTPQYGDFFVEIDGLILKNQCFGKTMKRETWIWNLLISALKNWDSAIMHRKYCCLVIAFYSVQLKY